ncbi:MAG TPA: DUF3576 domain-containing protein [Azospirillaceae bacterium]|nr:DUF3576 domain-containing protein [Azospirillaceae bacterium]
MPSRTVLPVRLALMGGLLALVSGCSWLGLGEDDPAPGQAPQALRQSTVAVAGSPAAAAPAAGQAVNAFLWRASLDTLAFMPIIQADPYGGVILTDWHTPPATPGERFKVNLYILDAALRADGVRATVFRQVQSPSGAWVDAPVAPETAVQLEDGILTKARQLRQQNAPTP